MLQMFCCSQLLDVVLAMLPCNPCGMLLGVACQLTGAVLHVQSAAWPGTLFAQAQAVWPAGSPCGLQLCSPDVHLCVWAGRHAVLD